MFSRHRRRAADRQKEGSGPADGQVASGPGSGQAVVQGSSSNPGSNSNTMDAMPPSKENSKSPPTQATAPALVQDPPAPDTCP